MKRAFLFLVLGPLSVFVTIFVMFVAVSGARSLGVAQCCAMVVAVLTLPVSAITGAVDGFIVPVLPILFLSAPGGAHRSDDCVEPSLRFDQRDFFAIDVDMVGADAVRHWRRSLYGCLLFVVAQLWRLAATFDVIG
jgi:hypothetical protein